MTLDIVMATGDNHRPETGERRLGVEGFALVQLAESGLHTVPTIVLGADSFDLYRSLGHLSDDVISRVVRLASLPGADEVFVRPSTWTPGMPKSERIELDRGRIDYVLTHIYRAWGGNAARAYRMAHRLHDDDCPPAIIIQALRASPVYILATRNPRTGEVTNAKTVHDNINNTIDHFQSYHSVMLSTVETVRRRPSQVSFQDSDLLQIVGVSEQTMTAPALFFSLYMMYQPSWECDLAVLRLIQPHMLSEWDADEHVFDAAIQVKGVPASPGVVSGIIVWQDSSPEALPPQRSILLVGEWVPSDTNLLLKCVGGLSTTGGTANHLALQSRGMGIPAVVGISQLHIDPGQHRITSRGVQLGGDIYARIDGTTGDVLLGSRPPRLTEVRRHYRNTPTEDRYVRWIDKIVDSVVANPAFRDLPEAVQVHAGQLRRAIHRTSDRS